MTREFTAFTADQPDFAGQVYLIGHSLGGIACHDLVTNIECRLPGDAQEDSHLPLPFAIRSLIILGSPFAAMNIFRNLPFHVPDTTHIYNVFHPYDPSTHITHNFLVKFCSFSLFQWPIALSHASPAHSSPSHPFSWHTTAAEARSYTCTCATVSLRCHAHLSVFTTPFPPSPLLSRGSSSRAFSRQEVTAKNCSTVATPTRMTMQQQTQQMKRRTT